MASFSKILIANRGEIACRIIRTAHDMGYETVAVFSSADRDALHVRQATEAIHIGPAPASESYLNTDAVLRAAAISGADAIHPGYGFLSENAEFAQACAQNGITFIGPSADAIALMGNKAAAKRQMVAANVACVPGYEDEDQSDQNFMKAAVKIGFPVMVKAAAGGGGRGMRLVTKSGNLEAALKSARSEAQNAFGSDELILEKAILDPRHIEMQIFADSHGSAIHLGERDCSIQRRHQKVIEEAPSPAISENLRAEMGAAAILAAKSINYCGAGTVEFLLASNGAFYFLEMNTRLQVEHPVTELVTGYDLVEWQIRIARDEKLPANQDQAKLTGHAIEARLYAEDPDNNFLPNVGTLLKWDCPQSTHLRCDHGLQNGTEITPYYDAMIAKVIAWGSTREDARRRLILALKQTADLGLVTNRQFLIDCLSHNDFRQGLATTAFIETYFPDNVRKKKPASAEVSAVAAALHFDRQARKSNSTTTGWDSSSKSTAPIKLRIDDIEILFSIELRGDTHYLVHAGDTAAEIHLIDTSNGSLRVAINNHHLQGYFAFDDEGLYLSVGKNQFLSTDITLQPANSEAGAGDGRVIAPMNGRIINIRVEQGQSVSRGQTLITLEAMKMEHEIIAKLDGTVKAVKVMQDDQVANRALLVEIEPA